MKTSIVMLVAAATLPTVAAAQDALSYSCTQGSLTRRVEVARLSTSEVPCEVRYHKEDGASHVLWNASVESGYCEMQAREFVAKLAAMGWTCSDARSAAVPSERPAEDDTAVLAPGR